MSLVTSLVAFTLRQTLDVSPEGALRLVEGYFTDRSRALPRALGKANERAWQALGVALAGDGFLDQLRVFFARGDERGIREQVTRFLAGNALGLDGNAADFRRSCLEELKRLRKENRLTLDHTDAATVARQTAGLQRFADPTGLVYGASLAVAGVADALREEAPNLAKLLRQSSDDGPPLLAAAFSYFFRREVETDEELAHGLFFDGLRQLSATQAKGFSEVRQALDALGPQFDHLFDQLGRIETTVHQTHDAVLDLQAEVQRLGGQHSAGVEEMRRLIQTVQELLDRANMQRGEVRSQHSCSIQDDEDRQEIDAIVASLRRLPPEKLRQVPALLNGTGKLLVGVGDYEAARRTFAAVADSVGDAEARAEASYNAYRAALEARKYDDALRAIVDAGTLAPRRFAPFPLQRYQPQRILGAGGFGTAFLCQDRKIDEPVVVKTLHTSILDRSPSEVFGEAQLLRKLNHPAIIGVRDWDFADPSAPARPYVVMDFFPGQSLAALVSDRGALPVEHLRRIAWQIAQGMKTAHEQNVLHRDLKPENVLVQKEGDRWQVKIIDFGLAMRPQAAETRSRSGTMLGASVAGTLGYAPPEQMGDLPGVSPGPYSDIYSFGKLCCQVLFLQTTELRQRHWNTIPQPLAALLERCTEHHPRNRPAGFDAVLTVLKEIGPAMPVPQRTAPTPPTGPTVTDTLKVIAQVHADARKLADEQHDLVGAVRVLETIPEHLRDRVLFDDLRRRLDEINQLNEDIRKADRSTRTADLRAKITALLALQPQREDLRRLLATLPDEPNPGDVFTNALGIRFAWIPSGTFVMGSPPDEEGHQPNERRHKVTLTRGFSMGVTLVTQGQWLAVMGSNPSKFRDDYQPSQMTLLMQKLLKKNPDLLRAENRPVDSVSWEDCQEFCRRLGQKDGRKYRLPSEAEWEYACRAGTTTAYYLGTSLLTDQANFGNQRRQTTPVSRFPSNPWGLYDMHGNVWQWCADAYSDAPRGDEKDPLETRGMDRVLRGGCWGVGAVLCRAAFRFRGAPAGRNAFLGVRVCYSRDS
jgi:formylglycine-generating enzyme required for sulfatase activity